MPSIRRYLAAPLVAALAIPLMSGAGPSQNTARLTASVWIRDTPAEPVGSFRVFLANGTTLSGSCTETYRIDRWRMDAPNRITIVEDGRAIVSEVTFAGQELRMRLRLTGGVREERYRAARVPYLCPRR
ncbi:MAG: hypothetical protein ICV87_14790 [Gemmatimonadetes bacterium]|nr:hypothetical protein [Gemmatimonadota bacterium]